MLRQIASPELAVYAVWVPMSGAEEKHVRKGIETLPDSRVRQYWDPANGLGFAYQKVLGTPEEAWDVYMLYAPDAKWSDTPPEPNYWMHQLSKLKRGERLDSDKLRSVIEHVVSGAPVATSR